MVMYADHNILRFMSTNYDGLSWLSALSLHFYVFCNFILCRDEPLRRPQIWHSDFMERYLAARIAARDSAVTISHPSLLCFPGALNVADSR